MIWQYLVSHSATLHPRFIAAAIADALSTTARLISPPTTEADCPAGEEPRQHP